MTNTPDVIDNQADLCFEMDLDGQRAVAAYEVDGDVVTFTHTVVPEALRHRGIATKLVEAGLAAVRRKGWRVVPQCSMVAAYMARHPETHDLLAPGVRLS